MSRIRLKDLKKALRRALEGEVEPEKADEIAERVMNLFGYDKTITDNILSTDERDYFYKLEDHDILSAEEETVNLPSGKRWRIHYWKLKEKKIEEILEESPEEKEEELEESIYDQISDDMWQRAREK